MLAGVGDGGGFRRSKTNTSTWDEIEYGTMSKRVTRMQGECIGQQGGEKLPEFTGIMGARRRKVLAPASKICCLGARFE